MSGVGIESLHISMKMSSTLVDASALVSAKTALTVTAYSEPCW